MTENKIFTIRLCLLGAHSVGKTSLCSQFVSHNFNPEYQKTNNLTIFRSLILLNNTPVMLEIDDLFAINHPTLSEDQNTKETFEKVLNNSISKQPLNQLPSIYSERKIDGLIFVFDLNNPESFTLIEHSLKQFSDKELERLGDRRPRLTKKILVGNKSDLNKQAIKQSDIDRAKQTFSVEYFRTSAKNMRSVDKVFRFISNSIFSEKFSKVKIDVSTDSEVSIKPVTSFGMLGWCDCSKRTKTRSACQVQ